MPKVLKSVEVKIEVSLTGDIGITETALVEMSSTEYPTQSTKRGIPIILTSAQEAAIVSHVTDIVIPQAENS
tara:strand:+ start:319 stop:534 length:216 start_codon:yes stop_codon:yes gene_type:complete